MLMKCIFCFITVVLLVSIGCRSNVEEAKPEPDLDEVVNAFGMKFIRIPIDPALDVPSDPPFPTETYYIQETEITGEHLEKFREYARSLGVGPEIYNDFPMSSPSEWREFSVLAQLMSEYDPKHDYRLPTKSEWVFACMDGYEQKCIRRTDREFATNGFGLAEMLDGDVECVDQVGLLMGIWKENWPGIYDGHEKPDCACQWWTICNPDADDSLNEIIMARFVLVEQIESKPNAPE